MAVMCPIDQQDQSVGSEPKRYVDMVYPLANAAEEAGRPKDFSETLCLDRVRPAQELK